MKTLLQRSRAGECLADLDIIDLHGHFGNYNYAIPDVSARGLVEVMDRLGVSSLALSDMTAWSPDIEPYGNDRVLNAMREFPERILGYAGIWPKDIETVRRQVALRLDQGFIGLKLHNANGFSYLDDAYRPAYEMADQRHMPMLFHAWGHENDFAALAAISRDYPNTAIIMAHSGTGDVDGTIELARKHDNIYLDLSFSASPRGMVKRLVEGAGADKVTFGSDCYFFSMTQQIGKVLGVDIPDTDKIKVLSANARRILAGAGISGISP